MNVRCPHCDHSVRFDDDERGQNVLCQGCGASVHIPRRGSPVEVAASDLGIHPALMRKHARRAPADAPDEFSAEDDDNASVQLSPSLVDEKERLAPENDLDVASAVKRGREAREKDASTAPGRGPAHDKASERAQVDKAAEEPPPPASTDERPVPQLPGFEVLGTVGRGAMGHVYRATDDQSGRLVAVKVLAPELAARPDFVARFEREAAALRAVNHPGVVAILGSGSHHDVHFLTMDFVEGKSLRRMLDGGPLAPLRAVHFARQIAQGLYAAHSCGVIHRDLKPENISVQRVLKGDDEYEERLVLLDFGLAGMAEALDPHPNLTKSRMTMGTVNYMAPEQRTDAKRVDERADIYALGVIFYELLTGDLPLGRFKLPTERGLNLPLSVDECISKTLDREREKRFVDAAALDRALASIEKELCDAASQETVIGRNTVRGEDDAAVPSEENRTQIDTAPAFSHPGASADGKASAAADDESDLPSAAPSDVHSVVDDANDSDVSSEPGAALDTPSRVPGYTEVGKATSGLQQAALLGIVALALGALIAWAMLGGDDDDANKPANGETPPAQTAAKAPWRLPTGWTAQEGWIDVDATKLANSNMAQSTAAFPSPALKVKGRLHFASSTARGYGAFFLGGNAPVVPVGLAIQESGDVHLLKLVGGETKMQPLTVRYDAGDHLEWVCSLSQAKCNVSFTQPGKKPKTQTGIVVDELRSAPVGKWHLWLGCREAHCRFDDVNVPLP